MPSIFLFARSNVNRESNADAEQQNVQLPSRSQSESDVTDREGCTHKRIRHEDDIGKFRFLTKWCSMPTEPTEISKYASISVTFEFCHLLEDVIETRSGSGTNKDDGQSQTNQGSHKHLITVLNKQSKDTVYCVYNKSSPKRPCIKGKQTLT